jgi:hypothetical protein
LCIAIGSLKNAGTWNWNRKWEWEWQWEWELALAVSLVRPCVSFQIPKSHIFCMSTSALAPTPTVNPSLLQFRENCKTARVLQSMRTGQLTHHPVLRIGAGTDVQHLRNQMQNILDLRRGQSDAKYLGPLWHIQSRV